MARAALAAPKQRPASSRVGSPRARTRLQQQEQRWGRACPKSQDTSLSLPIPVTTFNAASQEKGYKKELLRGKTCSKRASPSFLLPGLAGKGSGLQSPLFGWGSPRALGAVGAGVGCTTLLF